MHLPLIIPILPRDQVRLTGTYFLVVSPISVLLRIGTQELICSTTFYTVDLKSMKCVLTSI